ncbi:MAG: glycosyl hydrolase, partial [Acidimicrobiales bacterium]
GDEAAAKRIVRALDREHHLDRVAELDEVALVLSVFATGAPVGAELARRRVGLPSVVFCTDATVHRMWVHEATDLFVTTCELAARSVLRYRPEANVAVVAPAVRASFFEVKDKEDSRRHFGVPAEGSCVLLVSGGWGIGPVARSAAALAERGHEVMAVSGWNRRLKRELDALEAAEPRVHSLGLTDEMPAAMAAADVVVSAPGQTCHEVRVVGRPLVVLDSVPGHGRENLLHETMSGGAAACSPTPESVVGAVGMVLKQGEVPPPWPVSSPDEWQQQFLGVLGRTGVSKLAYREGPEETGTSGP